MAKDYMAETLELLRDTYADEKDVQMAYAEILYYLMFDSMPEIHYMIDSIEKVNGSLVIVHSGKGRLRGKTQ